MVLAWLGGCGAVAGWRQGDIFPTKLCTGAWLFLQGAEGSPTFQGQHHPCCCGRPQSLFCSYTSACWGQDGTVKGLATVLPSLGPPCEPGLTHCSLCKHLGWHQLFSQQQWHYPCSAQAALSQPFTNDRSLRDNACRGE